MESAGTYSIQALTPTWIKEFPVIGKGVVIFNVIRATDFAIAVRPKYKDDGSWKPWQWIAIYVSSGKVMFLLGQESGVKVLVEKTEEDIGFEPDTIISYWLSYDRDRMVVKYGKGYYMEDNARGFNWSVQSCSSVHNYCPNMSYHYEWYSSTGQDGCAMSSRPRCQTGTIPYHHVHHW